MNEDRPNIRVVVLIGGSGSNLQAIIHRAQATDYEVVGVISHKPDVYGLTRAEEADIPSTVIDHKKYASTKDFENDLLTAINTYQADLVVLAGFMRILSAEFVHNFEGRMLNIHPALLPKYKGLNTHQRVLEHMDEEHGATVHFVTADLDGGPIIAQAKIHISGERDVKSLQARVLKAEHWLYPKIVNWYALGRLTLSENTVLLDGRAIPSTGIVFNFEESKDTAH